MWHHHSLQDANAIRSETHCVCSWRLPVRELERYLINSQQLHVKCEHTQVNRSEIESVYRLQKHERLSDLQLPPFLKDPTGEAVIYS